jgi:methylenetetrahydrofolate dehydrogenase (NADP+)/methenyltetrahydrofolate cyclohydrolase
MEGILMEPILLDGKALADKIKTKIRSGLEGKKAKAKLITILVGDNPSSHTYVSMKVKACESVGMLSEKVYLSEKATTEELLDTIEKYNRDPDTNGILLQHPSPPQIDERLAFDTILPSKDVDGVTSYNYGRLAMNLECYYPCTPYGMILLLEEYKISLSGKHAVVVGRSPILGKPMASMMTNLDATVTLCHSKTKDLPNLIQQADVVVGAVGKPEYIQSSWIKNGAVLLDAGYNPGNVGDIDIKNSLHKSSHYTPVPGGIGPMTIASLLYQTYLSYQNKLSPILK